jgi:diaminohydroxyphosphoribosylaminopyrimidine deaminase/5-amino-6-(5-phosphoribosylamino)uracil reductase
VVSDKFAALTTIVVGKQAPKKRLAALTKKVNVLTAPAKKSAIDLRWLLKKLDANNVTSLLVEGGGEVNASFLLGGFAQRVVFFYAPKILGGRDARKAVAGEGVKSLSKAIQLRDLEWRKLGEDLLMTARVGLNAARRSPASPLESFHVHRHSRKIWQHRKNQADWEIHRVDGACECER